MAVITHVALLGAGGNLGKFVIKELQSHPDFQITIVTRESSSTAYDSDLRVVRVTDDYSEESLVAAFEEQDVVVNMLNAMASSAEFRIIDTAIRSGVKRYIPSNFGNQAENKKAVEVFPLVAGNDKAVDYLRTQESKGISWTAIITGIFIDLAMENRFLGYNFDEQTAQIWDSGDAKWSTSTRPHIAKTVLEVLKKPDVTKNRYIHTCSFTTSQNELLRSIERVTGSTWRTTRVNTDDMIRVGQEGLRTGDFMKIGNLALAVTYGGKYGADFESDGKLDNELLGIEKEELDEVVADFVPK